jgi:hypothetical protein
MTQTRRDGSHEANGVADGQRDGPNRIHERRAAKREWRVRPDWLSISRTKWLRTSRECLDCWAL